MKSDETPEEFHAEFDLSQIQAPSLAGHAWIQMGYQLICHSCQREHAVFLKPGYQYQGNDERGKPIVKKIW